MKKIDFVFFDAGGGHRSAATALAAMIGQQGRPWRVRLVNLQEVLEPVDIFRRYFRIRMEDIYNHMLKSGWTLGAEYLVPVMHWLIRMFHGQQVRLLREFWAKDTPELVVSVIPNFNRALFEALKSVGPRPLVTLITDLADYPPHFWMEKQNQYMICGTDRALDQAYEMRYNPHKIYRVSGMILRPEFYQRIETDRTAERERLGLRADLPTGIMLFGGQGSWRMLDLARRLEACRQPLQMIVICGRNERLTERARKLKTSYPLHVVGFTSDVPRYMQLSDFFIGKPGPGSISEALAMKLPVLIERNAWTLPQERYNADWVLEKGVGMVVANFRHIAEAVDRLLEPKAFAEFRERAGRIRNRAVFEVPEILQRILRETDNQDLAGPAKSR
jgi:UDP-N-acetylglucosamine:LPS N-acetylglucosamine transferase